MINTKARKWNWLISLLSTGLISRLIVVFRPTGKDQEMIMFLLRKFPQLNIFVESLRIMTRFLNLLYFMSFFFSKKVSYCTYSPSISHRSATTFRALSVSSRCNILLGNSRSWLSFELQLTQTILKIPQIQLWLCKVGQAEKMLIYRVLLAWERVSLSGWVLWVQRRSK